VSDDRTVSPRVTAGVLLGAALVLTAFNLRPAVTSVGALLREVQVATGMSGTVAGVLVGAPPLCFGAVGLLAGRLARRRGTVVAMMAGLSLLVVGLVLRVATDSAALVIVTSLVALSGIALTNVLMPVAVKEWFPDRVGRMTGLYAMGLAVGTAAAAGASVPIAELAGGWRVGLGAWAVPAVLALAALAWLARSERGRGALATNGGRGGAPGDVEVPVHHSRQAWALTAFFGLQALAAYTVMGWLPSIFQDAGISPTRSGLLLALTMVIGAPVSVTLPELAARRADQRGWVVVVVSCSAIAYLGLLLAPGAAPVVWSLLLGLGLGAFPLALTLIGLRAATGTGTAHLSSLAQGVGYLVSAAGPVAIGAMYDLTGSWGPPLGLLLALLVPQMAAGLLAGRPGHVDMAGGVRRR
jgi:MFS transporter, CP family, cyanate transporter